jgi:DNA-binding response OmpR family regulator
MNNIHVTIIEDDDFLRSLAVTKLQKEGMHVTTASNGEEGLTVIESEKPEIIILDLMLPTMSGFEVLEQMQKKGLLKTMKVVVFSNLGDDEDITKCMDLGATDYLVKANFTLDELVQKVKTLSEVA